MPLASIHTNSATCIWPSLYSEDTASEERPKVAWKWDAGTTSYSFLGP